LTKLPLSKCWPLAFLGESLPSKTIFIGLVPCGWRAITAHTQK
jgi:hypothetical protein